MKARLAKDDSGELTYVLVFAPDDEVMRELKHFALEKNLTGSQFTAIGAFREVTLG